MISSILISIIMTPSGCSKPWLLPETWTRQFPEFFCWQVLFSNFNAINSQRYSRIGGGLAWFAGSHCSSSLCDPFLRRRSLCGRRSESSGPKPQGWQQCFDLKLCFLLLFDCSCRLLSVVLYRNIEMLLCIMFNMEAGSEVGAYLEVDS